MIAADVLAWLKRKWPYVAVGLLILVTILFLTTCRHETASNAVIKAQEQNDKAKDQAAIERRADDQIISNSQQERTDAIKSAPAGETGPATRALNCTRWMQQHPGKDKPAGC